MLEYLALGLLIVGVTMVIYVFIYIHDIPHAIALKRNHPQAEAIHVACWLSIFTLHALWPLVFIWAVSNPEGSSSGGTGENELKAEIVSLKKRLTKLEGTAS